MTTLAAEATGHALCTLTACLDPLHPGPCKGWKGHPEEQFLRTARQAKKGIRAYNTPKTGSLRTKHKAALRSYVDGSGPINRSLRHSGGVGANHDQVLAEIKAMDQVMAANKLHHPIQVMRAVSPTALGGISPDTNLEGVEYTDHAFGSTGTDLGLILKHFSETRSGKRPIIANIVVPKGMGAVRMPAGQFGDEKEILLERGAHYRIVADHGYIDTPKGKFRHVSMEVVPGAKSTAKKVDLGENNQYPRGVAPATQTASGHELCTVTACIQTGKPGLCKGQHRGGYEPGARDPQGANQGRVAQAKRNIQALGEIAARAAEVARRNFRDPKLAAAARRAAADYERAKHPDQRTLGAEAAKQRAHDASVKRNTAIAKRDVHEQDRLDTQARLAKMSPAQRRAYYKEQRAKAAAAAKKG